MSGGYDFNQMLERRNTDSLKWEVADGELPMWVADMDFQTAPAVIAALQKRAASGIYGYAVVPKNWYTAIQDWWRIRHHFEIEKNWLIYCTGVIPAITCAVKRLTSPGDNIVVQTPVYDIFFHSIENHGRHVLENPLSYDGAQYSIDFDDLEEKLANPLTTMLILCNPHNPIGKVWSKEELEKIGTLCAKYHVVVVSDEIHCDLTFAGHSYIPFASVSEVCRDNSVTCISASKAFNLAGLQTAAVVVPSERLYHQMERELNADEVAEPNVFAADAVIAAFTEGEGWLTELCEYIDSNRKLIGRYLKENIPSVKLTQADATCLVWLDVSGVLGDATELCRFIREKTGLYLLPGSKYRGNGGQFIRMNIACPKERIEQGLLMFRHGIEEYEKFLLERC